MGKEETVKIEDMLELGHSMSEDSQGGRTIKVQGQSRVGTVKE